MSTNLSHSKFSIHRAFQTLSIGGALLLTGFILWPGSKIPASHSRELTPGAAGVFRADTYCRWRSGTSPDATPPDMQSVEVGSQGNFQENHGSTWFEPGPNRVSGARVGSFVNFAGLILGVGGGHVGFGFIGWSGLAIPLPPIYWDTPATRVYKVAGTSDFRKYNRMRWAKSNAGSGMECDVSY